MFEFDKIVSSCARTPRTATVMTFLKYGHPPVISAHERTRRSSLFSCSRNVIHYCIEILPLRTCTYVVKYYYQWYCPLICGSWATYVLSAFGPLVTFYVSVGPLSLNVLVERLPWTLLVHVVYSCMLTETMANKGDSKQIEEGNVPRTMRRCRPARIKHRRFHRAVKRVNIDQPKIPLCHGVRRPL
jgi:hypothetical protein